MPIALGGAALGALVALRDEGRGFRLDQLLQDPLERDLLAERTADALADPRRKGRPWKHPPFGYENHGNQVLGPDKQATLERIRILHGEGKGFATVASLLTAAERSVGANGRQ